ncbi:MAG TPA: 2-hydroxyglutaryl-CoA dehydratase [Clostridium sp.]|uniref:Acyl-CoA dehydratase activase n=1 Tax=Clostridium lapidicellarium TaxID=3240931 RepID=A0ABV4DWD2_9CLOT|nr:acyl-CoA dehydratase activase [uncultured Clostridium sp.]NLU09153.1 2-hydroxyglutaryl-CoA dehydratase [Clostridiales bacterium]HBC97258.1 2-hydroxyglutaryl-CoA dehydratase [Clostridium sp.]
MYYMGVDVGSVSTDVVIVDKNINVLESLYLRTKGRPINAIQEGLKSLKGKYDDKDIAAVGTTGSGRQIAASVIGADVVKNEITSHAVAALHLDPDVKTIIEIGGQDSKIILLQNGVVLDFAMNTVCAAGTGSFLDRQASRLDIPIDEFGNYALKSTCPARIAGRCAVFAESDMIHKQQMGCSNSDIIKGLCNALVRNYLNNVAKGKEIHPKIFFQGGVAANIGMKNAFEEALGEEISVPQNFKVMGAIGAAILAKENIEKNNTSTKFNGFDLTDIDFVSKSFECTGCPNRCEVVKILGSKKIIGFFGGRCERWNKTISA